MNQVVSAFRIIRLLRVLRAVRLFKNFKELNRLMMGLVNSVQSVVWIAVMFAFLIFTSSIFVTKMVGKDADSGIYSPADAEVISNSFGTIGRSMITLSVFLTCDDWSTPARTRRLEFGDMRRKTSDFRPGSLTVDKPGSLLFLAIPLGFREAILATASKDTCPTSLQHHPNFVVSLQVKVLVFLCKSLAWRPWPFIDFGMLESSYSPCRSLELPHRARCSRCRLPGMGFAEDCPHLRGDAQGDHG